MTELPNPPRAFLACLQLQVWREKGYQPQLYSSTDGWVLRLDNVNFAYGDFEQCRASALRYKTEVCPSIEAAVDAALEVIQP